MLALSVREIHTPETARKCQVGPRQDAGDFSLMADSFCSVLEAQEGNAEFLTYGTWPGEICTGTCTVTE